MFEGIHTALITPIKNDKVDHDALEKIVDRQLLAGVQGIVVCATTGEGSTLNTDERRHVIDRVVKQVASKAVVTVGTGTIDTRSVIESTRIAADMGADAALVASPPYVRPSQEGIANHFEKVADQGGLPIVLYNVPSRTSSDILPSTVGRLASHPKIVAIKEATGSILRAQQVIAVAHDRIRILSGDDPVTLSLLVAGGHGVICTASNVVPERWVQLWEAWKAGDLKTASSVQSELLSLHEALFLEANPGPVKAALHLLGLIEPEIRTPLTWPTPTTIYRLAAELERHGYSPRTNVS